jgi:hypothetical protein
MFTNLLCNALIRDIIISDLSDGERLMLSVINTDAKYAMEGTWATDLKIMQWAAATNNVKMLDFAYNFSRAPCFEPCGRPEHDDPRNGRCNMPVTVTVAAIRANALDTLKYLWENKHVCPSKFAADHAADTDALECLDYILDHRRGMSKFITAETINKAASQPAGRCLKKLCRENPNLPSTNTIKAAASAGLAANVMTIRACNPQRFQGIVDKETLIEAAKSNSVETLRQFVHLGHEMCENVLKAAIIASAVNTVTYIILHRGTPVGPHLFMHVNTVEMLECMYDICPHNHPSLYTIICYDNLFLLKHLCVKDKTFVDQELIRDRTNIDNYLRQIGSPNKCADFLGI